MQPLLDLCLMFRRNQQAGIWVIAKNSVVIYLYSISSVGVGEAVTSKMRQQVQQVAGPSGLVEVFYQLQADGRQRKQHGWHLGLAGLLAKDGGEHQVTHEWPGLIARAAPIL